MQYEDSQNVNAIDVANSRDILAVTTTRPTGQRHGRRTGTVLVVEDDPAVADALVETLRIGNYVGESCARGDEAVERVARGGIALVITDVNLPGTDGFGVLQALCGRPGSPPVVMMTAYGTIDRAVRAMQSGALDFLTKPFRPHELLGRIERWFGPNTADEPIAVAEASRRVLEQTRRIAAADANVLITGESGTGKEVIARFVHRHSKRANKPFVPINCAAIPENLLESTLFGHEKYAFTGANRDHKGKFQQADGGILLLDEVTEMSLALQAKLLRVLQEREVEPVGGKPLPIDVRVIATSNRSMAKAIADKSFREDLYFRLGVLPLELPPLRDRPDDILPLARAILARHASAHGRRVELSARAETTLLAHFWPGNVRELDNVLLRALVLTQGDCIDSLDLCIDTLGRLPNEPTALATDGRVGTVQAAPSEPDRTPLPDARRRLEREQIREALVTSGGHRGRAAEALGIAARTLRYHLQRMREDDIGGA